MSLIETAIYDSPAGTLRQWHVYFPRTTDLRVLNLLRSATFRNSYGCLDGGLSVDLKKPFLRALSPNWKSYTAAMSAVERCEQWGRYSPGTIPTCPKLDWLTDSIDHKLHGLKVPSPWNVLLGECGSVAQAELEGVYDDYLDDIRRATDLLTQVVASSTRIEWFYVEKALKGPLPDELSLENDIMSIDVTMRTVQELARRIDEFAMSGTRVCMNATKDEVVSADPVMQFAKTEAQHELAVLGNNSAARSWIDGYPLL